MNANSCFQCICCLIKVAVVHEINALLAVNTDGDKLEASNSALLQNLKLYVICDLEEYFLR